MERLADIQEINGGYGIMLFLEGKFVAFFFDHDLRLVLRSLIGIAISQSKGKFA